MQEVTFNLQIITPLFLAGANYKLISIPPKKRPGRRSYAEEGWDLQPEIRSPSLRGPMRYWLRAAVGGLADVTTTCLKDVALFEQATFGSTEHGSAITIRVTDMPETVKRFKKESFSQATATGRDYLLWSMPESGKGEDYKPDRLYFPEGNQFSVTLSERTIDPDTPQALPYAIASMWLLTYLGGIGSRSHRCAGSLQVKSVTSNTGELSFAAASTKEELQTILREGIREIRSSGEKYLQNSKKQVGAKLLTPTSFDSLTLLHPGDPISSPHACRIWILTDDAGSAWQSQKAALDDIGSKLKDYRSKLPTLLDRTAFGLPLNAKLQDEKVEKALKDSRRASPILLRITKLHTDEYVGVAVLFKTALPAIIDPVNKQTLIPAPDYSIIESWIKTKFRRALEVRL